VYARTRTHVCISPNAIRPKQKDIAHANFLDAIREIRKNYDYTNIQKEFESATTKALFILGFKIREMDSLTALNELEVPTDQVTQFIYDLAQNGEHLAYTPYESILLLADRYDDTVNYGILNDDLDSIPLDSLELVVD
jgi:hypothetical protein